MSEEISIEARDAANLFLAWQFEGGMVNGPSLSKPKLMELVQQAITSSTDKLREQCEFYLKQANNTELVLQERRKECEQLREELERVKRGDFTPEEFQNLCHNRHEKEGCSKEEFFEGCAKYQQALFGCSHVQSLHSRIKELEEALGTALERWKHDVDQGDGFLDDDINTYSRLSRMLPPTQEQEKKG